MNTTRISLIFRIRDADDSSAWCQFVDIYGPLIYRFGRRKGLQDADAADMVQEVLGEVSKSIGRFDYNPNQGRFRNWLFAIARHTLSRQQKKNGPLMASGDSQTMAALNEIPSPENDWKIWEAEYHQHLMQWAYGEIRGDFLEKTWQAFVMTAIEGLKPQLVAEELNLSVGSVYVAKNRVIAKLKNKIASVDDTIDT